MAELKKYKSFEDLKLNEHVVKSNRPEDNHSEFEAFLKQLQSQYANKKNTKTNDGKPS